MLIHDNAWAEVSPQYKRLCRTLVEYSHLKVLVYNRSIEQTKREIHKDMAKFYGTDGISHHLFEIIKNTKENLILISPYLKFSRRIQEELKRQDTLGRNIRIVYGKSDLRPEESEWLAETEIRTRFREHLHAKCYMNESYALITSMNLYEFSQQHNDEMGILVSAEKDRELYKSIKSDVDRIIQSSEPFKIEFTRIEEGDDLPIRRQDSYARTEPQRESVSNQRQTTLPKTGFCLRCGTEIPCDPERPYCNTHYRSWARYKNEEYEEKRCHTCGSEHSSSMAKPVCLSCYRKYRGAFRKAS